MGGLSRAAWRLLGASAVLAGASVVPVGGADPARAGGLARPGTGLPVPARRHGAPPGGGAGAGRVAPTEVLVGLRPVSTVSRYVFGANLLWAYNAEGAYDPRTGRFYPGFVDQLRRLGVTALRYPGGTTSDNFFWQRAIGPRQSRLPNEPYGMQAQRRSAICCVLDGPAPSNVGPDEFGRLLGQLGAAGTVTVNFATGTAQQAADLVAYMTARLHGPASHNPSSPGYWAALRARNGHSAPYDVPYWEVGNEQMFPGQYGWRSGQLVSLGRGGTHCPGAEAATCLYVFGGTTAFSHQRVGRFADQLPLASLSNGAPGQTFYVYFPPVAPGAVEVYVAGRRWARARDLAALGPGAKAFSLDPGTGAIHFGNAVHGAVPPVGAEVTASYKSGPHQGFLQFYAAMKRMAPGARICESEEADLAFLAIMGRHRPYDCVELHLYARPTAVLGRLSLYERQLMGSVAGQGAALSALQAAVRRYSGRRVPVVVTEYGQLVSPVPAADPQFNLSLEEGLFEGAQLLDWMTHSVPLAEKYLTVSAPFPFRRYPSLVDTNTAMVETGLSSYSAMIVHRGHQFVAEPSGEVIGLLRQLAGGSVLPVSVSRPGGTPPSWPVFAVAATGRGRFDLALVNTNPRAPLVADVRASRSSRSCALVAYVLDGPGPTAYNTPGHPEVVTVRRSSAVVGCGHFRWSFGPHSVTLLKLSARFTPLLAAAQAVRSLPASLFG